MSPASKRSTLTVLFVTVAIIISLTVNNLQVKCSVRITGEAILKGITLPLI